MKALVKKNPQKGLWLEDIPIPVFGNNDLLIKVKKAAICGTDLHIYDWNEWYTTGMSGRKTPSNPP